MNEKYLAVKKSINKVVIYEIPVDTNIDELALKEYGKIYCMIDSLAPISEFKLNPNYLNILLVVTREKILFFTIPETFQTTKIVETPRFVFDKMEGGFNSAVFNPLNSHIIACSCFSEIIQVWSVKEPFILKIPCSKNPTNIKWRKCGKILGFIDKYSTIKVYNIINEEFIFYLNFKEKDINFEYFKNDSILVENPNNKTFLIYEFKHDNTVTKKEEYKKFFTIKYKFFLSSGNYFIFFTIKNKMIFYDDFTEPIYNYNSLLSDPKIIKVSNNKIITKILDRDGNNVRIIILFNKKEKKLEPKPNKIEEEKRNFHLKFDISPDNINENYFKNCPKVFLNIIECLNYKYNDQYIKFKECKKDKKYLKIPEIQINLDKNLNTDLISLRNYVKKEIEILKEKEKRKEKIFKSINEEYIFYLNLLIKDETNPDLLLKYLQFLKNNKEELENKKLLYENFKDEMNYYSIFFEKKKLHKLFLSQLESEKSKFINLLQDYSTSIKNNNFENFKICIKSKYKGIDRRYFNQPISFELNELLYYSFNLSLYNDICDDEKKDENNLQNKLFIINEILKKKILYNYENANVLIPLIYFICHSEKEENCVFFLNMIESKTLTDKELNQNAKNFGYEILCVNKTKKGLLINNEYFPEPNELCFKNLKIKNYHKYEKYNFKYLIKNPPMKLDIEKIKAHLLIALKSRVFKEVYEYLTGNNNYQSLFSDGMITEYINI